MYSGTLNLYGSVDLRATRVGEDSSLQRLIRLVEEADRNQAPTQRIADRWASWLVPVALAIALLTGPSPGGDTGRHRSGGVLPCALVLATPTAIIAAIGQAAKQGVIIKSGEALERMGRAETVAFDKTGTLTLGALEVTDVLPLAGQSGEELLTLAASAESRSEHPLGRAIVRRAQEDGLALRPAEDFRMRAGRGISARIGGAVLSLGNEQVMAERGVAVDAEAAAAAERLRGEGKAVVLAAEGPRLLGILALGDTVRPEAAESVRRLGDLGVKTVLLTGDHRTAAEHLAARVGIAEVRSGLLPGGEGGLHRGAEARRRRVHDRRRCQRRARPEDGGRGAWPWAPWAATWRWRPRTWP
jgi:P-type E1-E2 ATPase